MSDLLDAPDLVLVDGEDIAALPATGEVLVARRPFNWHGRHFAKGEVVTPAPSGRKREVMARAGFIVAEVGGLTDVVAQVSAIRPDGLVCPDCAKVLPTPTGMKVHRTRVHGGN